MHALIPLVFIFILFNSHQLKTDTLYRANVFALIGISYFFFFQYTMYWYRIFPTESAFQFIPGLLITFTTVLIALSSWNKKSHPLKTTALCTLCALTLVMTFGFDKTIKERLAEMGGYFTDEHIGLSGSSAKESTRTIKMARIGLRIDMPITWKESELPSGHIYFTAESEDKLLLEMRPNCMRDFQIDTPTFVHNSLELFEANDTNASHTLKCVKNKLKECLLIVKYTKPMNIIEKWRWFKVSQDRSYSMMMDFLVFTKDTHTRESILHLLDSARPTEHGPKELCQTPAAWL